MVTMSFSVHDASLLHLPTISARTYRETHRWIRRVPNIFFLTLFLWWQLSLFLMTRVNYPCQHSNLFPCCWSLDMTSPKWLGSSCNFKLNVPWWKQFLLRIRASKPAGVENKNSPSVGVMAVGPLLFLLLRYWVQVFCVLKAEQHMIINSGYLLHHGRWCPILIVYLLQAGPLTAFFHNCIGVVCDKTNGSHGHVLSAILLLL